MTFIASVIANDGIAIVADSFVTSPSFSVEFADFVNFIKTAKLTGKKKNSIQLDKLIHLFKQKPGYTRNYAEKLFQFDNYSAITTAGLAFINEKLVKDLIREIKSAWTAKENYENLSVEEKLNHITSCLKAEVISHLNKGQNISQTVFIFSHYNVALNLPEVFKISIKATTKPEFDKSPDQELVTYRNESEFKVVTDGQDYLIDRFLFGSLYRHERHVSIEIVDKICKELKHTKATKTRLLTMLEKELLPVTNWDFNLVNLRPLSLQEAVDFAALLLRIVMDIQVYTEKIPTVGGVIKLAVIGKDKPFEFISGSDIAIPKLIY